MTNLFTVVAVIMLGILTTSDDPLRSALVYTPLAVAFTLVGLWPAHSREGVPIYASHSMWANLYPSGAVYQHYK